MKTNSFTLFFITIISIETAKIIQNTANIAHANKEIGRTIPLEMINLEIWRFEQAIHLAKVLADIKDGSKIILCKITDRNVSHGKRKNAEQFTNGILSYHWWKCKMLGWYQFRIKWYFEGASRYLRIRMSITPSLQLEQNDRTQKLSNIINIKIGFGWVKSLLLRKKNFIMVYVFIVNRNSSFFFIYYSFYIKVILST